MTVVHFLLFGFAFEVGGAFFAASFAAFFAASAAPSLVDSHRNCQ